MTAARGNGWNPILVACARARLRPRMVLGWAVVSLVFTAFVFLVVYFPLRYRTQGVSAEDALKATLPSLIIVQGVLLMLLGTTSVSAGIAQERESGNIAYQRMTPMTPTAKIIGYLFGLAAREYVLFALTLPFVAYVVVVGGVGIVSLLHFYAVFFTSVWMYHLVGLLAGMVASKPRNAIMLSSRMVFALYFVLPQFASLGFAFLEYLTVRPTFYRIVLDELRSSVAPTLRWEDIEGLVQHYTRPVAFFHWRVHPTLFTLALEGFLGVSLFIAIARRWAQDTHHVFSKLYALIIYAALQTLMVGSLWPYLSGRLHFDRTVMGIMENEAPDAALMLLMFMFMGLSLVSALLLLHIITPERNTFIRGLRRARKMALRRVPLTSDAASSLIYAVAMIAMTVASYVALMEVAAGAGLFFRVQPTTAQTFGPPVLFAAIVLCVYAGRELFSDRGFFLLLFVLWGVPILAATVLLAARNLPIEASYVALPSPIASLLFAVVNMFDDARVLLGRFPDWQTHLPWLTWLAVAVNLLVALVLGALLVHDRRDIYKREWMTELGTDKAGVKAERVAANAGA